ncbi:hypothetical protein EARG_03287 [Escherichia coli H461]|nr:hypothetical protein EARG_03287 [Escherichia coli H461]
MNNRSNDCSPSVHHCSPVHGLFVLFITFYFY